MAVVNVSSDDALPWLFFCDWLYSPDQLMMLYASLRSAAPPLPNGPVRSDAPPAASATAQYGPAFAFALDPTSKIMGSPPIDPFIWSAQPLVVTVTVPAPY